MGVKTFSLISSGVSLTPLLPSVRFGMSVGERNGSDPDRHHNAAEFTGMPNLTGNDKRKLEGKCERTCKDTRHRERPRKRNRLETEEIPRCLETARNRGSCAR
jgi:hypothetical protein